MLFLWIFGDNVEDQFGHAKFVIFYLLAGIAATFAQYFVSPESIIPNVGASGAIAGVLGAYIFMFPQSRVNVLVGRQIVALPAFIVLGLWIALQFVPAVGSIAATDQSAGGVAYMAHVGGFVSGIAMTFLFRPTRELRHRSLARLPTASVSGIMVASQSATTLAFVRASNADECPLSGTKRTLMWTFSTSALRGEADISDPRCNVRNDSKQISWGTGSEPARPIIVTGPR